MTDIIIDNQGNTYNFGVTFPPNTNFNPGITGNVSRVFDGLSQGTTYSFVLVSYNNIGYSGYAGPVTTKTFSEFSQPQSIKDLIYVNAFTITHGNSASYNNTERAKYRGWGTDIIAAFQGDYLTGNFGGPNAIGRAYPFEKDPVDPENSSPWHNIFYSFCISPYVWGARSFDVYMPFGTYPQTNGLTWKKVFKETYTDPNGETAYCPARWKGFTSACRALLEGRLIPSNPNHPPINQPCNLHMYLNTLNGYSVYVYGSTYAGPSGFTFYPGSIHYYDQYLQQAGGNTQQANELYYAALDEWIADLVSIKSPSATAGKLYLSFDACSGSLTPSSIGIATEILGSCGAFSPYLRGASFELGDWYVISKIKESGIGVCIEAKPSYYVSADMIRNPSTGTVDDGLANWPFDADKLPIELAGKTFAHDWRSSTSVEYWLHFSNPENNYWVSSGSTNPGVLAIKAKVKNEDIPYTMRWNTNVGPLGPTFDPYKARLTITNAGACSNSFTIPALHDNGFGWSRWLYSPFYNLYTLYTVLDTYKHWYNSLVKSNIQKGIVYDEPSIGFIVKEFGMFARGGTGLSNVLGKCSLFSGNNTSSMTGYYYLDNDIAFKGNRKTPADPYILFNGPAGPMGYTGPMFDAESLTFWYNNIQADSFNNFIKNLYEMGITSAPAGLSGVVTGWTGSTYPNDYYSINSIPLAFRVLRAPILAFAWSWPDDNASDSTTVQNWINNSKLFEYVSPMVFLTRSNANDDWKNGLCAADKTAAYARLKGLSAGKRAVQPYSFAFTYWNYSSEGLTGVSGSSTMFNDDGTSGVCSGIYANIWTVKGLSFGKAAWEQILSEMSATGASIDWLMSAVEKGAELFSSFTIRGITGVTAALGNNTNYSQSYLGITSLSNQLLNDGATISRIHLSPPAIDYVVWNKSTGLLTTKLLEKVLWEPTIQYFPSAHGINYSGVNSGSSTDVPRDVNGHPLYEQSKFGSASSPPLYGVIGQLATAWKINPSDTTQIIFGSTTDSNFVVSRSPWNSFLLDIQNIRTLRRNDQTTPFVPWIASVKYTGTDQAGVCGSLPPPVGYADVTAGFNPDVGLTFSIAGNSAYYYEMIRHACLYGTKSFGYWNAISAPIGITQHAKLLNDVIVDVNSRLGGFTIGTADYSSVSWQTNLYTSGAPKIDGSYLWRVTVKPGLTLLANGITLSTNIGTVGTWITTPGPTLAGIGLTFI